MIIDESTGPAGHLAGNEIILPGTGGFTLPPGTELLPEDHTFAGRGRNAYKVIYADPPWRFKAYSAKGLGRSADRHYPTMDLHKICQLPVRALTADDCHLFLWCTGPFVAIGAHVRVMRAWGFKPSSMAFLWCKPGKKEPPRSMSFEDWNEFFFMGQGKTTRQNAEYLFLGRKGNPPRLANNLKQVKVLPLREHSRKPDEFYREIEKYGPGPYLEMFSRTSAPGWDVWGKDVDTFALRNMHDKPALLGGYYDGHPDLEALDLEAAE